MFSIVQIIIVAPFLKIVCFAFIYLCMDLPISFLISSYVLCVGKVNFIRGQQISQI